MRVCRTIEFLSHVLPIRTWRGNIIQRHIDACPSCQAKLAVRDEAKEYVIAPKAIGPFDSIWPAVEVEIRAVSKAPEQRILRVSRLWKQTAGVAAAAGVLFLLFLLMKSPKTNEIPPPGAHNEEFRLDSLEVRGKPAMALFYQARDSQITIIWASEGFKGAVQ